MIDCQNQATSAALSIEEAVMGRQIEAAERQAKARCPTYDESNINWKKVDLHIQKCWNMEIVRPEVCTKCTNNIYSVVRRSLVYSFQCGDMSLLGAHWRTEYLVDR